MTTFSVYDPAAFVTLSDCVQVSLQCGRQSLLDPWAASTGFARFRVTSSNSTNLANVLIGGYLNFRTPSSTLAQLVVLNKVYTYGNKSANGTYEDDYCEIELEGKLGLLGRVNIVSYVATADTLNNQNANLVIDEGVRLNCEDGSGSFSMREYTMSGTVGDYASIVGTTTNGQLQDYDSTVSWPVIHLAQTNTPSTLSFSDTTTSATQLKIEAITFSTIGNNTYDEAIITLNSGPIPVVAIRSGASQPYRILQLDTIWADSNQALDYANWLLWLFQDSNFVTSVTFSDATQTNPAYSTLFNSIGKEISVTFRGTTYTTVLEGLQFDAVPGDATTTAYLTTGRQVTMFILDSSTRGVLDTNRLGY